MEGGLQESLRQLRAGIANLAAHIRTAKGYGMPCVVAVNRFPNDTDEEVELVRTLSLEAGALDAQHNTAVVDGGEGAADLARAVVKAANAPSQFTLTYSDGMVDSYTPGSFNDFRGYVSAVPLTSVVMSVAPAGTTGAWAGTGSIVTSSVPTPGAAALLGLAGLGVARRRR